MAKRALPDWLSAYLKYTEDTEPPKSYHTWIGIASVASALQRKVWLRWGHEIIFPNIFVILVGPSGRCRKGFALNIGKEIMSSVSTISLTSESITQEALIRHMKNSLNNFIMPGGEVKFHSSITCISPELSVLLGQNDIRLLAHLTDWYDSHEKWTYETKGAGIDELHGVCMTLIGGTAPDWLQSMLPQEAIGGGFTSRCIFIVEEDKEKIVPEGAFGETEQKLGQALKQDLEIISNLSGELTFTEDARNFYINWYTKQEEEVKDGKMPIDDPRFYAYTDRRATHLRKLSIIMAMSNKESMELGMIQEADIAKALRVLSAAEKKMPKAFGGLGKARYSEATHRILEYVIHRRRVSRQEVLRMFYRDVDTYILRVVEEVLESMGVISITVDTRTKITYYTYIGP